jgi:hypothetical protein
MGKMILQWNKWVTFKPCLFLLLLLLLLPLGPGG